MDAPVYRGETLEELWDAKKWSESILEQAFVQESKVELEARLREFLAEAKPADRRTVEGGRQKVLKIMQDSKAEHDKNYPGNDPSSDRTLVEKAKAICRIASETAYEYTQILDVMVTQAPEYVALVHGAVKILLVVQISYEEMKRNVDGYMVRIKSKFDMIDHPTAYTPTANLVAAISQMYDYFHRFLAEAVRFYTGNRLKNWTKSIVKPWKRLESFVISIEQTYSTVKDTAQFRSHTASRLGLDVGLANLAGANRPAQLTEAILVKFSEKDDLQQMGDLFRQRVDENIDQLAFTAQDANDRPEDDLDQLLGGVFIELRDFNKASADQEGIIKQLPGMHLHRSKKNILKVNKVMDWLESDASQLLRIDGNDVLGRFDFNALFAVPLVISGENNYEDVVVLRHFCGDDRSVKANNCRTLVQALLFQLFKARRKILSRKMESLTRGQTNNITELLAFFIECIKDANANCTFIIIDSIDYLEIEDVTGGPDERQIVLEQLDTLVKESKNLMLD